MEGMRRRARLWLAATVTISLGGLALAQPLPVRAAGTVGISAGTLHFGSQEENTTSSSKTVRVTNNDVTPLIFSGIFVNQGDNADFVLTHNGCGHSLAAGDSCGIDVAFRPGAGTFGPRSSELDINDDASTSLQTVTLIGQVASPDVHVDPPDLSFGAQAAGTVSAIHTVSVQNDGHGDMRITDLKLDPTDDFDVVSGDCFTAIAPGHGCSIEVRFSPKTASGDVKAIRTSILTITDNDVSSPTQLVSLDGSVPTSQAQLSITSIDFGSQAAGTKSAPHPVTLRNTGTGPLTIGALEVKGLDPNDFGVAGNACPGSLDPGQSCEMKLIFTPEKADGVLSALLTITDDAPNVTQTVAMRGTATPGARPPAPAPGGGTTSTGADSGSAAPATTPSVAAPAIAVPTATPDTAIVDGPAQPGPAAPTADTGHTTLHAAPATTIAEQHNVLVGAVLSALANDGSLIRALLTVVMMVLPFAVIAVIAGMGRRFWLRRRASQSPSTD
jgi:hypothetical protein